MNSRRERVLAIAVLLGSAVVVGTEIASALGALTVRGVLVIWTVIAGLGVGVGRRLPPLPTRNGQPDERPLSPLDYALRAVVALFLLVTLVVAVVAPPQNPDALAYHMPRVMHWIQNASLAHYPTHDERQLYSPPFGEIVRLHLQLVSGGDRLGGLLQWFAMLASLVAVSLLTRDLGGRAPAQGWAVLMAVTIPTGILLASSGKTEWVIALWLAAFAHFLFRLRDDPHPVYTILAGCALGLALLTRLTTWFYAGPFLAAFLVASAPRWRRALAQTAFTVGIAALLFAPHAVRNLRVFGNPIGDAALGVHFETRPITPATVLSGVVRNAASLLETPSGRANAFVTRAAEHAHRMIGLDPSAPGTTSPAGPFHVGGAPGGDSAGAAGLVILTALAVAGIAGHGSPHRRARLAALAALAAGYVLFSAEVRWQAENGRILLPALILTAPVTAAILAEAPNAMRRTAALVVAGLPLLALPALLGAESRPLVGAHTIFNTSRRQLLLTRCDMRDGYLRAADAVREMGWRTVGLDFASRVAPCEYALWPLLADGPAVRLEHVNVRGLSARLADEPRWKTLSPDGVFFVRDPAAGRPRLPPAVFLRDTSYGLVRAAGAVGLYARETPADRRARLARLLGDAETRLRHRQRDDGSWETLYTDGRVFERPQAEIAPYVPWVVAEALEPVADAACLTDVAARAREFVRRQGRETARPPAGVERQALGQLLDALRSNTVTRDAAVDRLDRTVVRGAPDEGNPPVLVYYSLAADGQWRCHWSVDVGYAEWIRAYFEIVRRWPESLPPPACPPAAP